MGITFDHVTATVATTAAAPAAAAPAAAQPSVDHDRRRLDDLVREREERLARLHAD